MKKIKLLSVLSLKVVASKFKHHPSKLRVPNDKYVYFVQSYNNCISTDESLPENSLSKAIYCLRFSKNKEINYTVILKYYIMIQ